MKVSVGIITRNRFFDLQHCLGSLLAQTQLVDELFIVSSSTSDFKAEKSLINNLNKNTIFNIRHIQESRRGFPFAYNTGLERASYDWVAFIDDDCIAGINWYAEVKRGVENFSNYGALLGSAETYFKSNTFSISRHFINELGKVQTIKNQKIFDLEILDAKNVIYNKQFLSKFKLCCDQGLTKYGLGASQDCDLGMQIQEVGGKAMYLPQATVTHKDPVEFFDYYQKLYSSIKHHMLYEHKWEQFRSKKISTKKVSVGLVYDFFKKYVNDYQLPPLLKSLLAINVFVSFIFTKLLRMENRFNSLFN